MTNRWFVGAAVCALLAGTACGEDLEPRDDPEPGKEGLSAVEHLSESSGIRTTRIDATSEAAWVHLDLETGAQVEAGDPWDIAFQRMAVISNGGVSGNGGAAVAVVDAAELASVTSIPAAGWIEDTADGPDDDEHVDSAFGGPEPWYEYDLATHTLAPRERVYVVRTVEGNHFKIAFTGYYNDAGTSGFPTFRWGALEGEPVPEVRTITVDASGADAFVAVDLRSGEVVAVDDLESSSGWDIAFRRTVIRTNGGTSGPGQAAVAEAEEATLDAIVEPPPTEAFVADELLESPRPDVEPESGNAVLATWFDYDMTTHAVSPRDARFVMRTADGSLAKFQIVAWEDGLFTLHTVVAAPGAENF